MMKKQNFRTRFNKSFTVMGLALVLGVATFAQTASAAGGTMYFNPNTIARPGSAIAIQIRVETGGQAVNALQADFTYPTDKLTFTSIDAAGSAFDVDASSSGGGGTVSVARGSTTPKTGDLLIATINFNVAATGTITLALQNSSVLVRSSDSTDILTTKQDATLQSVSGTYKQVYRMANWKTKERLFTTDANERDYAVAHYEGWVYEGVAYQTFTTSASGTVPVYRMANWKTKERLFTTDANERDYAVAHYEGWVYEGVAYYTFPSQVTGTLPVYRMANWKTKERLFTTDANERDYAVAHYEGWVYEGVAYYTSMN